MQGPFLEYGRPHPRTELINCSFDGISVTNDLWRLIQCVLRQSLCPSAIFFFFFSPPSFPWLLKAQHGWDGSGAHGSLLTGPAWILQSSCETQEVVPESNSLTGHDSLPFTEKGHELIITWPALVGFIPSAPPSFVISVRGPPCVSVSGGLVWVRGSGERTVWWRLRSVSVLSWAPCVSETSIINQTRHRGYGPKPYCVGLKSLKIFQRHKRSLQGYRWYYNFIHVFICLDAVPVTDLDLVLCFGQRFWSHRLRCESASPQCSYCHGRLYVRTKKCHRCFAPIHPMFWSLSPHP